MTSTQNPFARAAQLEKRDALIRALDADLILSGHNPSAAAGALAARLPGATDEWWDSLRQAAAVNPPSSGDRARGVSEPVRQLVIAVYRERAAGFAAAERGAA